ncbi:ATP-dependent zinc protease family protein [Desulfatitalea alkaliphila]|uniref:ATP-dependent zinc protease n=1 Tax=Desulfatitalea alkaliphila TaxID=2929485 RepID=A0AA41US58_9BACT|nr:ATP-dependent zinc protease [Desulfatitalea alkaliphila]MCJ8502963.1 ATP-dependent zinc protease [Desulfatitalea alkaliphila]
MHISGTLQLNGSLSAHGGKSIPQYTTVVMRRQFLLYIVAFLLCALFLLYGCFAPSALIHKEDLADIDTRLAEMDAGLHEHAEHLELLTNLLEQQAAMLEQQKRLMMLDIEQNTRSFEYLEEVIKQHQSETRRRLAFLGGSGAAESNPTNGTPAFATDKLLVGGIEKVRLTPPGRLFHARVDTGATTSSLDARDITPFERNGSPWVRFKIKDPEQDTLYELEKPVARRVRILQASSDEADRRPVVKLQIHVGPVALIEEFTLVDRTHLDYQVLIGRNILRDLMVVDVARKFVVPMPEKGLNGNSTP